MSDTSVATTSGKTSTSTPGVSTTNIRAGNL